MVTPTFLKIIYQAFYNIVLVFLFFFVFKLCLIYALFHLSCLLKSNGIVISYSYQIHSQV